MILSERFLYSRLSLYGVINSVVTKKKKKKKKGKSLSSILPSDMSSGGLADGDGVSSFTLQVRGDNVDNVVRGKGHPCPTDPARGKILPTHFVHRVM